MKYTLQEAGKLLKALNDRLGASFSLEDQKQSFVAATVENIEEVRPDYDYAATRREQEALRGQIRAVKHAVNLCNVSTEVPGFDMTVDQLLVLIPQLTAEKNRLYRMTNRLPRQRCQSGLSGKSGLIEYDYANYDLDAVRAVYEQVSARLSAAQTALDRLNATVTVDLPF